MVVTKLGMIRDGMLLHPKKRYGGMVVMLSPKYTEEIFGQL